MAANDWSEAAPGHDAWPMVGPGQVGRKSEVEVG